VIVVSPLNNVFTFRNAHTCLQCTAYQARGGSNFPRQMRLAFHTHKPTAKVTGVRHSGNIPVYPLGSGYSPLMSNERMSWNNGLQKHLETILIYFKVSMLVFCVVAPCGLVGIYQRFGGTYCLHIHGHTALQPKKPTSTSSPP
jgi:hypothetical protein